MKITSRSKTDQKHRQFAEDSRLAYLNLLEDMEEEKNIISLAKAMNDALLESMGDGMISTDKEGVVTNVNRMAEKLLSVSRDNFLGKKLVEVLDMYDGKGVLIPSEKRPITISLTKGKSKTMVCYYNRKNGTKFPAAIIVTPVILQNKIVGAMQVLRDISREQNIDKTKTELIYLVSHQLRSPLTAINWYAQLLQAKSSGRLNPKQTEYATEILSADKRMTTLINSLLNVSRLELGNFSIKPIIIDIVKLAKNTINIFKFDIKIKKINFTESYHPTNINFLADAKLLSMVIQNLISNAVKYTPTGGKVSLKINKDSKSIYIIVSDTGIGIPKSQQVKIFTKLFRGSNAGIIDPEGTGLGLYIVKEIINNSGGKIHFESKEGKGTTFYISYPLSGMTEHTGIKQII